MHGSPMSLGVDGGPVLKELLPSFKHHIAYQIWHKGEVSQFYVCET